MSDPAGAAPRIPETRVPTSKRFMWGIGGFADATILYGFFGMINAVYVNALGVNAVLVGVACAVPRFLDALSDPLAGHLSDNTRSRWGRRKPWLLAGLIICAVSGVLMWSPPLGHNGPAALSGIPPAGGEGQGSWWSTSLSAIGAEWETFLYLSAMTTLLMAVGYTLFNVPHIAMGYEMTTEYDVRTHLFKWRYVCFGAAGFLTPWLIPLCMWFEGDRAQVLRGSQGVYPVALIMVAVILATGIPSLFCAERTTGISRQRTVRFLEAVRMTFRNKPFLLLASGNFIARFGMAVTGIFFYYLFVYNIGKGNQVEGASLLAIFFNTINIATILAMTPIAWLSTRLGKKSVLLLLLAMSAVAYASLLWTFTNDDGSFLQPTLALGGITWSPLIHWPSLVTAALIGVFTNTMPMITNSMIADVCDYEEWNTGMRREGFYGAAYTSIEKIAWSASLVFQGVLLTASGFSASLTQQVPGTIDFWTRALIYTQPAGFLVGIIFILFYPLTRARVASIEIDLRKRTTEGTPE